jgi:hypothetical protein
MPQARRAWYSEASRTDARLDRLNAAAWADRAAIQGREEQIVRLPNATSLTTRIKRAALAFDA